MSYSPHKITIDLDEYNELIALNVTYMKFLHKVICHNMVYTIDVYPLMVNDEEDGYQAILRINSTSSSKQTVDWELPFSLVNNKAGDNITNKLAEMFDRGLDYLETLK